MSKERVYRGGLATGRNANHAEHFMKSNMGRVVTILKIGVKQSAFLRRASLAIGLEAVHYSLTNASYTFFMRELIKAKAPRWRRMEMG